MGIAEQWFEGGKQPDRETIEQLAWLMGLDLVAIEADLERRKELSRIAWQCREDPNWQTSKAFWRYEEVFTYQDRQVFYNDWFDTYAVFGLPDGMQDTKSFDVAMHLAYYGRRPPARAAARPACARPTWRV